MLMETNRAKAKEEDTGARKNPVRGNVSNASHGPSQRTDSGKGRIKSSMAYSQQFWQDWWQAYVVWQELAEFQG